MAALPKLKSKRARVIAVGAVAAAIVIVAVVVFTRGGTLPLTGVVATDSTLISPEIQGRLKELLVREGDEVKEGQLLATIQPAEMQADLSFFQSNERQAAAMVAQANADLKYQEAVTISQIAQADANVAVAKAQVVAAEADAEKARIDFSRQQELHKSGVDSTQDFDTARTGYASAQARLDAVRKQAAAAEAAGGVARAAQNQVAARRAAVQGGTEVLAASGAQTEKAKTRLGYTEIHSPISGIVNVRAARQGEIVSPGQPILTLVNPDDFWVRVDIEESYIDQVKIGDRMSVRLPSGAVREGTVFYRATDADYATQRDVSRTKRDVRTFEIRLRCDNRDRGLALGMTAYVALPLKRR